MTVRVRPMQLGDIAQIIQIERESFSSPWSPQTYAYEVTESEYSYMMVVALPQPYQPQSRWARLIQQFWQPPAPETVVAYGGLWHLYDEAHISTIASHPLYRGQGYGEIALLAMLRRAVTLEAGYVALEVRVSNNRAQSLYVKHGFQVAGIKPHYYHDNGENAYDMRLPLTDGVRQRIEAEFAALCQQHALIDSYTTATD